MSSAAAAGVKASPLRRIVIASMSGTAIEWYDFAIYATAATLVFSKQFFPSTGNPLDGVIEAFVTYAVGFAARPLGGVVFGHFGDKIESARAVLDLLGALEQVGPVGAGKAMKLVNNVMSMCNVAVAAEAFTLGTSFGLNPRRLYEVLSTSGGRSGQFIKRIPYVLDGDFTARFAITLAEKDLRLAIQMAHELSSPMPVAAGVHQIYEQAIARGLGGEDQVAVIKLYEPADPTSESSN